MLSAGQIRLPWRRNPRYPGWFSADPPDTPGIFGSVAALLNNRLNITLDALGRWTGVALEVTVMGNFLSLMFTLLGVVGGTVLAVILTR
ncbi:MAG: hypothetical protein WCF33_01420 [Pseudonocardiaceae bacterium]